MRSATTFWFFSSDNQRERAQRICYANLLAGLHEQQRLQQAVEQAMEAPITEGLANVRHIWIFRVLSKVPVLGGLLRKLDAEFFKHEAKIEQAFNVLATRLAMSITTPNGTFRPRQTLAGTARCANVSRGSRPS